MELNDKLLRSGEIRTDCDALSNTPPHSYWMTDKAGHLCRFTKISKCNTLQATDYKDPPVIVVAVHRMDGE